MSMNKGFGLLLRVIALILLTVGTLGMGLIYILANDSLEKFLDIE